MLVENIRNAGLEMGLNSLCAIEKAAGLGNGVIRHWNNKSPQMSSLIKVADALNTDVATLMKGVKHAWIDRLKARKN